MSKSVSEYYQINENVLEEMADEKDSDYLRQSLKFYRDVKEKEVDSMSAKQLTWLSKIEDQVVEELRK